VDQLKTCALLHRELFLLQIENTDFLQLFIVIGHGDLDHRSVGKLDFDGKLWQFLVDREVRLGPNARTLLDGAVKASGVARDLVVMIFFSHFAFRVAFFSSIIRLIVKWVV